MKQAKLILPKTDGRTLNANRAKIVDADTGEEIETARSITVNIPLSGVITATVEILISEVEFTEV